MNNAMGRQLRYLAIFLFFITSCGNQEKASAPVKMTPAGARVDLDGLEAVAEFVPQALEAFGRAHRVVCEAQPQHAAAGPHTPLHHCEILLREM